MITIDDLEKTGLTELIGLEIGNSPIAIAIKKVCEHAYNIPIEEITTHALLFIKQNEVWYVIENHAKWNGVKKYTVEEYIENNNPLIRVILIQAPIDLTRVNYYLKFNPGYSCLDILELAFLGKTLDKGMDCSALVSACLNNLLICTSLNRTMGEIRPVDIQEYFTTKLMEV